MTFLFQSLLTIGLPLIALPLLIHLINLRRHKRVQWAAMDFLLESQKKNKKWILLRQILLLMLRTTAIALVVLMLAGPVLQSEWGRFFGKGTTHHLILLDDSYSMSDRWGQTTAFDEAKRMIRLLLDQATSRTGSQKLTLLRFSEVANLSSGIETKRYEQALDRQRFEEVAAELDRMSCSETALGPIGAVKAALGLPEPEEDETRIAYLVTDFRSQQWKDDTEIEQSLGELRRQVEQLHLIQCVDKTRPNLAITSLFNLKPESGVRAAGVECWMQISVANYGNHSAVGVVASISQNGHRLPGVEFEEIKPGEEVTRRFRTSFPRAGAHQLQASLESDPIETDNVRYYACQVPNEFPVLIIDGSRDGDDGYYLRTALNPGGNSNPGWNPQVERPAFLRNHDKFSEFAAICLLDVPRLDQTEVDALQNYVQQGGGLGIFLGSGIQRTFYNEQLYRDGTGLMPVLLDVPTQLIRSSEQNSPDVVVSKHPLFRIFQGRRNSFLSVIAVNFYYALDVDWKIPEDGTTSVLAKLRNGAPYVLEKKFGNGRVVLQLSKLSPKTTSLGIWSNWSLNPVFPVYANELIGLLSSTRRQPDLKEVGASLDMQLAEADYEPEIRVQQPQTLKNQSLTITPRTEEGQYFIEIGKSNVSGIWQFELQPRDAAAERRLVAVNVTAGEGDLHHLDRAQLAKRLDGVDYEFSLASQMQTGDSSLAGYHLQDALLYILLAALLIEQWLAYKASYHSQPKAT